MKRVAVIGAGISGVAAAALLSKRHRVTLFEAASRIGGHTDTHAIRIDDRSIVNVDSGFIVFNHVNYPLFSAWLNTLGVSDQASDMSFGVSDRHAGIEYGTKDFASLFADRRNLRRLQFLGMLADLVRFYREASRLTEADAESTLGDYLQRHRYGAAFRRHHIMPMCAALWSQPPGEAELLPMRHVIGFMNNHRMLGLSRRPEWRVVCGGSSAYLDAFRRTFHGELMLGAPVRSVTRAPDGVRVQLDGGERTFDAVFFACHSDQALQLLHRPTTIESSVLGAMRYRNNRIVVHSDPRTLPRNRAAWSSWNVVADASGRFTVSYWMNRLQSLPVARPIIVSVDPVMPIREELIHVERHYMHPVFTRDAMRAQLRKAQVDGVDRTYFCGAYWGFGFHEDGFSSAADAVSAFESNEAQHRAA